MSVAEQLAARTDRTAGPDACWPWTGPVKPDRGYGHLRVGKASEYAHRLAYLHAGGVLRPGQQLDHTCHDPATCPGGLCQHRRCVNPTHLAPVSNAENHTRERAASVYGRRDACSRGHEFTPANTRIRAGTGTRICLECRRIVSARHKAKLRAAR